jgi:hypothetical protein
MLTKMYINCILNQAIYSQERNNTVRLQVHHRHGCTVKDVYQGCFHLAGELGPLP